MTARVTSASIPGQALAPQSPGSGGRLPGRRPLRTVRAPPRCTRLKQALGRFRSTGCWFSAGAGCPALAVGVNETGAVRRAVHPAGDDVVPGDRLAGGAVPLFPFLGALRLAVGVQEQVRTDCAAAFLLAQQVQGAAVERWPALAAPFGPVAGLGGVIAGTVTHDDAAVVPVQGCQPAGGQGHARHQAAGGVLADRSRAELRAEQRGCQLAQLRKNSGLTRAQVAAAMGISKARVSQIQHGRITELDAVRAYIEVLGGTVDVLAPVGDWTVKVA
jgi:DNA-binding XRE family transcriptional regulator